MFKVNEYFDGKVKSLAFQAGAKPATVGVMAKGEYEFGTSEKEAVTLISGKWLIRLPDSQSFREYKVGEAFEVGANKKFQLQVQEDSAYLCIYG